MIHTIFFFSLLLSMVCGNLAWWWLVHVRAARLAYRRGVRIAAGLWAGLMFALITAIIVSRASPMDLLPGIPRPLLATVYIWHFLFILSFVAWMIVSRLLRGMRLIIGRLRPAKAQLAEPAAGLLSSRRQFLTGAAMVAPPAMATLVAWHGVSHLEEFRINRQTLRIPNLPPPLHGMTIAQVSDIHIGKWTDQPFLQRILEQTNQLRADLVLMTGDLIDFNLADLPGGLELVQKFQPNFGPTVMCEGNHDLMQGREGFEARVKWSGVPMPINSSTHVTVRGYDVQLLSLRWGGADLADMSPASSEDLIGASMKVLTPQVNPYAFPILLAHHPHAFDYLGDAKIPLTLSGHTHGGQINPAPWFKPALLRFHYLSGLYERGGRKLFVSNGVGNWFPLRVNAPAEIVHLTLTPA